VISQRRLLTLLLGVLFAVALTDQASALYDPGVGCFCSRDPIGYRGGSSVLYGFLNGHPVLGTDYNGLKCCLRTYKNPRYRWGSHSTLKCTNAFYSVYPQSRLRDSDPNPGATYHVESVDEDGTPRTEFCIDCIDEAEVAAKCNQLHNVSYQPFLRNCSWFTWTLLQAGMISEDKSKCSQQTCYCGLKSECTDSCLFGDIFPTPNGTESYIKCLAEKGCDPWRTNCEKR
jgi:hypothetical protein